MSRECFEVSVEGKVAHIRLSRPERLNVMTLGFWKEIPEIARELDARGDVRAAVISSTGKHFTAGMDLSVFQGAETLDTDSVAARGRFRQKLIELQQSFNALAEARFPVIAAVQGGCIGGGVDLVTACCLRYATRDAYFVIQEINIGMMADVGTFNRMPKQLPEAIVRELGLHGRQAGCGARRAPGLRERDLRHARGAGGRRVGRGEKDRVESACGGGRDQADDFVHPRPFGGRELRVHERAAAGRIQRRGHPPRSRGGQDRATG